MRAIFSGIFLVSVATLMLEVSLTRVFSVSQWYHFAFMVVSLALFGFGASGSFLYLLPSLLEKDLKKTLSHLSFLFSFTTLVTFAITNKIPFDPFRAAFDPLQLIYPAIYYALLSIPFFFSGLIMAVTFTKKAENVGKIYSSSLLGSGVGSVLPLVLSPLGGTKLIIISCLIGAIAAVLFVSSLNRIFFLISWIIVIIAISSQPFLQINISPYKSLKAALRYPEAKILYTEWNAFSRVDVVNSSYVRYAPGLSYSYTKPLPPQLGITIDGGGLDVITKYNESSLEFLDYLTTAVPYRMKKHPKVLILGAGGGLEVLNALYHNASSVTAVEFNPIIVRIVKDDFPDFSGGIYEKVKVEVDYSRSFVKKDEKNYDVIQLSLKHGAVLSSTGVYALTEDYIFTVEAFEDYLQRLSNEGVLSITRWVRPPPRETPRIVSIAISALKQEGVEDPKRHIVVIRSWGTITTLIKKEPFLPSEISAVKEFCKEKKFDIVYAQGIGPAEINIYNRFPEPYYHQVVSGILNGEVGEDYLFDISPSSDDKPFFFHFFKLRKIIPTYRSMGEKWQPFIEGGYLVWLVFVQALFLSFIFILLPVRYYKKVRREQWRLLLYFFCLGIGFMFIEIAFIQKFILFLGHPVYSVAIVLFSMLIFSGIGSLLSERLKAEKENFRCILIFLAFGVIVYTIGLPLLFKNLLVGGIIGRAILSLIIIAPIAFLMGIPFPLGIKLANTADPDIIPWAWAANGCSSVLGSILAVMLAMPMGFSSILIIASVVYVLGLSTLILK